MKFLNRWFSMGLPMTLLLFLWVTMRTTSGTAADTQTTFGFPFSWYCPMYGSSGAYGVAALPLVIDLLVYALIVLTFQRLFADRIARVMHISRRWLVTISVSIWIFTILCVSGVVIVMKEDVTIRLTAERLSFGYVDYVPHRRTIMFGLLPSEEEK
jgi:hypothetical protein